MKNPGIKALALLGLTVFQACETDFDITAPYREIPVVYGLLNTSDSIQYMRIQKAFLGEGNAFVMAQEPDSINYGDILEVKLVEYGPQNQKLRTLSLVRDSSTRGEGLFPQSPLYLYRTTGDRLVAENNYELRIRNTVTDSVITSFSEVVDSIGIISPNFVTPIRFVTGQQYPVRWSVNDEGVLYQFEIRFRFTETNTTTGVTTNRYLDWKFQPLGRTAAQSGEIRYEINGEDFFRFVAANLTAASNITRSAGTLDFNFTVADEEFNTYYEVNRPPSGLNQNIPTYTNISGGIGLFSSRLTQSVPNKLLDADTKNELIFGPHTSQLGFF